MLRYFAGAGSALLLILTGFFAWKGMAQEDQNPVPAPPAAVAAPAQPDAPPRPPAADERTKEQRRFDRADQDKNGRITLEELYLPRRRAFQRLDTNGDGRLAFEEWAVRTQTRFAEADANRDRALDRAEYAATAPRPRAPARQKGCSC
ncbi:histidine kinase [Sphingosinicella sp. LHD-64]|uniref:histidine kinase n=1 Tax=Sphingosinicella sp. LHD-64 TaxID=3072139 RepID=UPI00280D247F|nr:histidine kinase [Sphingosinicella sp. LHD-64]MDQ8757750.1 histidine kinase [Sphingosinicella sp. LHD-64]